MVVTLSPFKANLAFSDVLLPIAPFTETSGTFVNAEGRVQGFHAVVKPLAETRPAWKVLRVLANLLGLPGFEFESAQEVPGSRPWSSGCTGQPRAGRQAEQCHFRRHRAVRIRGQARHGCDLPARQHRSQGAFAAAHCRCPCGSAGMIDQIYGYGQGLIAAGWWTGAAWPLTWTLIKIVAVVAPLMGAVAYLTLWERKAIGFTQIRLGPNRIGPLGLLQPIADAVKLLTKEIILPTVANKGLFLLGPIMTIMPALAAWVVIPFGPDIALANINAGLLFLMAITSLEVYGVIIAGWASNSKYAFLGALRASCADGELRNRHGLLPGGRCSWSPAA
jgi:hypothetical protein